MREGVTGRTGESDQFRADARQVDSAVSGPFTDPSGGLIIYAADSAGEADQLLEADPFYQNGVFLRSQLGRGTLSLPNASCLPKRDLPRPCRSSTPIVLHGPAQCVCQRKTIDSC